LGAVEIPSLNRGGSNYYRSERLYGEIFYAIKGLLFLKVIPAKAGIHLSAGALVETWIPSFDGMTFRAVATKLDYYQSFVVRGLDPRIHAKSKP
jgi:hypothetical protein